MPTFAEFQQKAKQLATRLVQLHGQQMGCLGFFSIIIPDNAAMDAAITISMLAHSLDETYELIPYVKRVRNNTNLTLEEFDEFRKSVIIGIYLVKWVQYSATADSYFHSSLIELLSSHLEVLSLEEISPSFFNSCLDDLSYYCSFIYSKKEEKTYTELNTRLGVTIQKDIHETRNLSNMNASLWYGLYKGVMSSLGLSMY